MPRVDHARKMINITQLGHILLVLPPAVLSVGFVHLGDRRFAQLLLCAGLREEGLLRGMLRGLRILHGLVEHADRVRSLTVNRELSSADD